ncbi:MAG: spore coat assemly protein [Tepidanaerobacteraceae bacterium]|nr:spore coat assemly protein [Tepidanaerobacteraceae bacterium]
MVRVGDVVARISYGKDIFFKVIEIREEKKIAVLKGINVRIIADAPLDDLVHPSPLEVREYRKDYIKKANECMERIFYRRELEISRLKRGNSEENDFFYIPGRVLHVDGDQDYLEFCLSTYKQLEIEAYGVNLTEKDQPKRIKELVMEYNPDILVITGHDGLLKNRSDFKNVYAYRNSKYFIEAVREVRKYQPSLDDLVIFAGACQSHYEELIKAGANFASSPHRVFIHALDPVFVIEKIAYTPFDQVVSVKDVIDATITGIKGIGGVKTRGKLRQGLPRSPYE